MTNILRDIGLAVQATLTAMPLDDDISEDDVSELIIRTVKAEFEKRGYRIGDLPLEVLPHD